MKNKLFISLAILALGCEPLVTTFDEIEAAVYYEAASITEVAAPDTLLVMTWNIKFGGGDIKFWFDCHGERVIMTEAEVLGNMQALAAKIRELDPDILLLQEVDISSKRSAYLDQLQFLLDSTSLNYGAFASMWQVQYIPSDGLGRMNTGQAVLSKWDVTDAQRIPLELIGDQDALTQYFYLRRNILRATTAVPGIGNIAILSIHAAAFSTDGTKKKHIDRFKQELDQLHSAGVTFFAGGDLNTLPPGSIQLNNFDDSVCEEEEFQADDYTDEVDWLNEFYADFPGGYFPAVPLADYQADNSAYFSHSTDPAAGYKRKLDYIFTNSSAGWVDGSHRTHQEIASASGALSDHCPVTVQWVAP